MVFLPTPSKPESNNLSYFQIQIETKNMEEPNSLLQFKILIWTLEWDWIIGGFGNHI